MGEGTKPDVGTAQRVGDETIRAALVGLAAGIAAVGGSFLASRGIGPVKIPLTPVLVSAIFAGIGAGGAWAVYTAADDDFKWFATNNVKIAGITAAGTFALQAVGPTVGSINASIMSAIYAAASGFGASIII